MSLPDAIQPLGVGSHVNACIYGPTGFGKTRFIGSGSNTLIIRPPTEHTVSIRGGNERNVREWVVRTWDDMMGSRDSVLEYLAGHGEDWDVVALDSISLFQDTGLDDLWAEVKREKPHRARYGLDKQEYGINMHRLSLWVREIVGLDKFNFFVTAHPFWATNIDGDPLLMPYVQGKQMAEKVCGCMNVVGYLDVKEVKREGKTVTKRWLDFKATDERYAKDQFDAFEKHRLVNPTMPKFLEGIEAARSRELAGVKKTTKKRKAK